MSGEAVVTGLVVAGLVAGCAAAAFGAAHAGRRRRVRLDARLASDEPPVALPTLKPARLRATPAIASRRRGDAEVVRALPGAVEGIARSLRAGGSVRTALADAAAAAPMALGHDLGLVVHAGDHGIPLRQALERWVADRPLPGVRLTAAALVLGIDAGAGLARSLDGLASTLYERAAIEREVRALSTQARYSAGVLAIAPLVFLAVVGFLEPAALAFLVTTPAGFGCLAAGLALDTAGGWWMARITRRAT